MKFVLKLIPIKLEHVSAMLSSEDAAELGLLVGDRIKISFKRQQIIADVQITTELIQKGEVGLCKTDASIEEGSEVEVNPVAKPHSVENIRKKMRGDRLSRDEIGTIIGDTADNLLTEVEVAAFILSNHFHGMDFEEVTALTEAMIETGEVLAFEKGIVVDKHSVGGLPGNKVAQILVPTIAASGLLIPKTASKAITTASGTADTFETLTDVNMDADEIMEITNRIGGVIAWNATSGIAPADEKILHIGRHLSIDPEPHLLSSLMADKGAKNPRYVIIDVPVGEEGKIRSMEMGKKIASDFIELGRRLGIETASVVTYGGQPVGRAVGPALEAKEGLKAMEDRNGPSSLLEKSFEIAGILLEMSGKTGNGKEYAREIFNSGRTLEKYRQMIEAQGGDPHKKSEDIPLGDKTYQVTSISNGSVISVHNNRIVRIVRAAGSPKDKGAGIYVHKKKGEYVKAGEPVITIYAEKDWKLNRAIDLTAEEPPVIVSGMIIERYHQY